MAYQLLASHFRAEPNEKLKFRCLIDPCGKPEVFVSVSNKSSNLKRHLQVHHKQLYENKFLDLADYELQRLKLIQSCVELVTVNGRPLLALEDSGFQKSIEFQLNHLAQNGCSLTVNSKTVRPYIERAGDAMRKKIKIDLKNRFISVMADICTKNHRAVLGINAQYYSAGKIQMRTLGMIEMHMRHTGENIKDLIMQLLSSYDVSMGQVYAYTTDHALAMLLSAKLLNAAAIEEFLDGEYDFDPDGKFAEIMKNLAQVIGLQYSNILLPSVSGIGCAAHALHTMILDALEKTIESSLIAEVRTIMIELRNQINMIDLEARGTKLPFLDVLTRWNSIYAMVNKHLIQILSKM